MTLESIAQRMQMGSWTNVSDGLANKSNKRTTVKSERCPVYVIKSHAMKFFKTKK